MYHYTDVVYIVRINYSYEKWMSIWLKYMVHVKYCFTYVYVCNITVNLESYRDTLLIIIGVKYLFLWLRFPLNEFKGTEYVPSCLRQTGGPVTRKVLWSERGLVHTGVYVWVICPFSEVPSRRGYLYYPKCFDRNKFV